MPDLVFEFEKFQHNVLDQEVLMDTKIEFSKKTTQLDKYNYRIRHITGKENEADDFLSRIPDSNVVTQSKAASTETKGN